MISVDLGVCDVEIPVFDLVGKRPGPTMVVTGGMDGDEYTGIEAAYKLVADFSSRDFAGRLIVIPIVNIPGFFNESSLNPLDGIFPKMVFPGSANGSPTERLVFWLYNTYIKEANVWFDLHSGAITEGLNPYLWGFETDYAKVDAVVEQLRDARVAELYISENASWGSKAARLAKEGCAYILAESGARGERNEIDIERHVRWVINTMYILKMIDEPLVPTVLETKIFHHVAYISAPAPEGLWFPAKIDGNEIKKGMVLGAWAKLDKPQDRHEVIAPKNGVRLWWKETMRMQRGDMLCVIAHE
ncbi:MAG: succinylglutamate desuccinylase/aspartoacylase family protein [Candidatus Magasanikbacteria bacterium]|nr:succinylglutamate desuccinylase/aspartoacylase family protein [Candidatus Magasanikbacteria bacterium]